MTWTPWLLRHRLCQIDVKRVWNGEGAQDAGAREKLLEYFGQLPPYLSAIDACAGAHYGARALGKLATW